MRSELKYTVLHYWPQWLIIFFAVLAWILVTFLPKFENCPRGYLGPGGKHDQGAYENCTGGHLNRRKRDNLFSTMISSFVGIAGYIDRKVLQPSHVFGHPTCKDIYNTQVPFDPEGRRKH